jgi:hypothetical protein
MTRLAWIVVGAVSALAVGLAVALAISLGGGDEDDAATDPAASGLQPPIASGAAPEEFLECMEEQGVEPPSGLQEQAPEGFEEALEACRELMPEGSQLRIGPP